MSTQQQKQQTETEAQQSNQQNESSSTGPQRDPRYEETTKSAYGTNGDAQSAFSDFKIKPSRTKRRSALRKRFVEPAYYSYGSSVECFQWDNGAGLIEATNRQRRGSVRLRMQDGEQLRGLSADQLYDFLREHSNNSRTSAPDIGLSQTVTQHGAETDYGSLDTRENFVIEFDTGDYLVVLYDASANRRARTSAQRAGMLVRESDPHFAQVERIIQRDAYGDLSDLVAPDEVLASDLEVIDSSTYRNGSGRANAGGFGDEDRVGDVIIRQGEFYTCPRPDLEFPEHMIEKPLSEYEDSSALGSHIPRDQVVIEEDDTQQTLGESGPSIEPGVYVRGTIRHERNEHSMFNLYDVWHKAVENTEDMVAFERSNGMRVE